MPISDSAERVNFITSYYGATGTVPTSFDVALFNGDPTFDGVEITGPGYARVTIANNGTTWTTSGDQVVAEVTFPAPTGAWDEATHFGLYNGAALGETDAFDSPLDVTGAGAAPVVEVVIYFGDTINDA